MKKTVAILGATGHIAKGLVFNFLKTKEHHLYLYSRSATKTNDFLTTIKKDIKGDYKVQQGYQNFFKYHYDVIINCIGVGTLSKFKGDYSQFFKVIEEYDNLAIKYLSKYNPAAIYISIGSGSVYGRALKAPADENTVNCIAVNHIKPEDSYPIVRIYTEAKHRVLHKLNIVDLRLFSYFSRFIDLADDFFITDLLRCLLKKEVLATNKANIVRDYIHPNDLFTVILKCLQHKKLNAVFDVSSARPVTKNEILRYFSTHYGLKFRFKKLNHEGAATGFKRIYCPKRRMIKTLDFKPCFTSLTTIKQGVEYILQENNFQSYAKKY